MGGMGVVYKSRDPKINRLVALKVIRTSHSSIPRKEKDADATMDRFYIEAQAAGQLSHQHIVTIYDVGEDIGPSGTLVYIAMEFLDGKGLDHHIEKDTFNTLPDKIRIIKQLAEGLNYAHSRDIIHRDVKPSNIIVTEEKIPKLTDFGLARFADSSLTMSGTIVGTPNYMAPEQVKGKAVDSKTDFFSLSVIFYELLTGEKPFGGDTITAVIYRVVNDDPTPPRRLNPNLPPTIDAFMKKALAKNHLDRHKSGKEYIEALDNLMEDSQKLAAGSTSIFDKVKLKPAKAGEQDNGPGVGAIALFTGAIVAIMIGAVMFFGNSSNSDAIKSVFTGSEQKESAFEVNANNETLESPISMKPVAIQTAAKEEPIETAINTRHDNQKAKSPDDKLNEQAPAGGLDSSNPASVVIKTSQSTKPAKLASMKKSKPRSSKKLVDGYLTIQSEPKSAEVFVGEEFLGVTPINKLKFRQGKYRIRLLKNGYQDLEQDITLGANSVLRLAMVKANGKKQEGSTVAVKKSSFGKLEILTPPQSTVVVDGREYGDGKILLDDLTPGSHRVYVQVKGKKPYNESISIKAGKKKKIDLR